MFCIEWIPIPSLTETEKFRTLIRDPKDIPILAAAVSAKPDLFVTDDKDFHTPEVKKLIPVYTATQALNSL
jgi:predicted nucleic acid-binding protein